jgi:hypothetical protein
MAHSSVGFSLVAFELFMELGEVSESYTKFSAELLNMEDFAVMLVAIAETTCSYLAICTFQLFELRVFVTPMS